MLSYLTKTELPNPIQECVHPDSEEHNACTGNINSYMIPLDF